MKKRILFVESDRTLLDVYVRLLDDEADRWKVSTAFTMSQALQLMEQTQFDVVVADLRLPGTSGGDLMEVVRDRCPLASRIILSEISDQEEVSRCLNSIHQFLPKPFEVAALKATLSRIGGLDAYLHDPKLKMLVSQLGTLPSLPSLYVEIMGELGKEDPAVEKIAGIISRDPGMTARILQITNSAVLGLARKISSPFDAVQYLGFGTVRSLVLSAHIFSSFKAPKNLKGFSVNQLWNHALGSGSLARMIMRFERSDMANAEDANVAGMLHDVGKLMLADSMPEQFQQALTLAGEEQIPFHEAEQKVFGATHAGVAAYLLGLWGLPTPIVEAIAFHHTPTRSDVQALSPLTAVHVADALEHKFSKAEPVPQPIVKTDDGYLAAIGFGHRLDAWHAEAEKLMDRNAAG